MNEQLLAMPQWTTGARLLRLGEAIDFRFFLPAGVEASGLTIFPTVPRTRQSGRCLCRWR